MGLVSLNCDVATAAVNSQVKDFKHYRHTRTHTREAKKKLIMDTINGRAHIIKKKIC